MTNLVDTDIRHSTFVRAPPEKAYAAFATSQGLDAWFTTGAEVDARPDGKIVYRWKDWGPNHVTTQALGTVHEARPPQRFVFDWDSGDVNPTIVEIDFKQVNNGTLIRLRENGFQDTPRGRERLAREATGWGEALTLVKFYLEHGLRY